MLPPLSLGMVEVKMKVVEAAKPRVSGHAGDVRRRLAGGRSMKITSMAMADFVAAVRRLCASGPDRHEIERLLSGTRIDPPAVDAYVRFAPGRYTRHLVHKDRDVELLVLCWAPGAAAPIHGHEGELCWARVERGRLRFTSYREASRAPLRLVALGRPVDGGPGYVDGPADIHAVENPAAFQEGAVSLHVYCRPYDECDLYDPVAGTVRRVRLQYDSVPPHPVGAASC
jgi:predicted metal-dependent enzyme (double-stranded beta helix superfamily)